MEDWFWLYGAPSVMSAGWTRTGPSLDRDIFAGLWKWYLLVIHEVIIIHVDYIVIIESGDYIELPVFITIIL